MHVLELIDSWTGWRSFIEVAKIPIACKNAVLWNFWARLEGVHIIQDQLKLGPEDSSLHHCGHVIFLISQMNIFLSDRQHWHFLFLAKRNFFFLTFSFLTCCPNSYFVKIYYCSLFFTITKRFDMHAHNFECAIHLDVLFFTQQIFPRTQAARQCCCNDRCKDGFTGGWFLPTCCPSAGNLETPLTCLCSINSVNV